MLFAVVRWLLAAACLIFSFMRMTAALKIEGIGAAGHVIFSMGAFITAILLIAPETAFRLAEWCSRPFTNILFPSEEFRKPPLSYLLARKYNTELRFDEAIEQYQKIILHYPDETAAYVELLELARDLGDDRLFQKYAELFKKRFKQEVPRTTEPPQ